MFKTINRNIKKFNKLSNWLKISISLIIVLSVYKILEEKREPFIQEKEFILKEGPQVYDKFYSEIYDDLIYDKVKNELITEREYQKLQNHSSSGATDRIPFDVCTRSANPHRLRLGRSSK